MKKTINIEKMIEIVRVNRIAENPKVMDIEVNDSWRNGFNSALRVVEQILEDERTP